MNLDHIANILMSRLPAAGVNFIFASRLACGLLAGASELPVVYEKPDASLLLSQAIRKVDTAHIAVATSEAEQINGEAPTRNMHTWIQFPYCSDAKGH